MDNFNLTKFLAEGKLYEAMSPQDVVDIADTVAEEFTIESAEEGDFLVYSVGRMEGMSFELDTDLTSQSPKGIDTRGVGEGWGGIFRIKPTEDGYEVRNAEKGGLVAMIDAMGNFKMLSADESRAEMGMEEAKVKEDDDDFLELVGQGVDSFPRPSLGEEEIEEEYGVEGPEAADIDAIADEPISEYTNKMKKSELKEMIRAAFLNEAEDEEVEDVEVDTEEEIEDVDVDVDADVEDAGEMDVEDDAKVELTGDKAAVSDNLEAALEAARALGDEKLVDQIGNTITFFTRAHIVKEAEIGLEEALNKPIDQIGPDIEKRMQTMGFDTKVFANPSWGIPPEAKDAIEANPKLAAISFDNRSGMEIMRIVANASRKKDLQKVRDYFQVPEQPWGPEKQIDWVKKQQVQNINPGDWYASQIKQWGDSRSDKGLAYIDWYRMGNKKLAPKTTDPLGRPMAAESLNESITFPMWNKIK